MSTKLRLNGIEYEDIGELLLTIPVLYFLELKAQSGMDTDALRAGKLTSDETLAAWAYLLRRNAGESIQFKQAAVELTFADALIQDEHNAGSETDPEGDDPNVQGVPGDSSET